jgi:hypothetical protein
MLNEYDDRDREERTMSGTRSDKSSDMTRKSQEECILKKKLINFFSQKR